MDPSVFAAVGGALIGLVAGAAGCLRNVIRARPGAERRHVLLWSAVFTLALASFLAGVCLVPRHAMWLFGAPVLTIVVLAVYAVRRAQTEPGADTGRM
jgi:uncharacterized membrane protein